MSVIALVIVACALAIGTCAILAAVRYRRTPTELRGDWWTPFEREFRAYAKQSTKPGRERRRHRGERA